MVMDILPARSTDPDTSHRGVRDAKFRVHSQQGRLLRAYASGRLIIQEAAGKAGLTPYQASKRRSELEQFGMIRCVGERKADETGSDQRECVITIRGQAYLNTLGPG